MMYNYNIMGKDFYTMGVLTIFAVPQHITEAMAITILVKSRGRRLSHLKSASPLSPHNLRGPRPQPHAPPPAGTASSLCLLAP